MSVGSRQVIAAAEPLRRLRLAVSGRVQGVGFRPTVARVARSLDLVGFVRNGGNGVDIEVEGVAPEAFEPALMVALPPLAAIERIARVDIPATGLDRDFRIAESAPGQGGARIPADAAICRACLSELLDPRDRRHRHAFIACADCGPRYTMTRRLPYDRAATAMNAFPLCEPCTAEYGNPDNRRFHAEATCCPACGPRLSAPVEAIAAMVRGGGIVALKGVGGYHLACDARDEAAVARLRARKHRPAKPFAVMVASLEAARSLAEISPEEAELLASPARPVTLLRARARGLAHSVAPDLPALGLFLPSTPLHVLLFHELAGRPEGLGWLDTSDHALVMTSANVAGDPIVIDDAEAREALADIADLVVSHDRAIQARADDGVARVVGGAPAWIRRSRGVAPEPIALGRELPRVLGIGAHLKATACLVDRDKATLTAHVGDLDAPAAIAAHEAAVRHLLDLTRLWPVAVAHDRHPDYASTRLAERMGLPAIAVQHHHAHAMAVAAEHGVESGFIALVLDGVGLGTDGTAWGGELLAVDGPEFSRLGHLKPLPLPGGDKAAREPWRIAAAVLIEAGRGADVARRFAAEPTAPALAANFARMEAPRTTSCGRLFDAAAALLGAATRIRYEAEAAMRLEGLVDPSAMGSPAPVGGWSLAGGILDMTETLLALADERDSRAGATRFHRALVEGLVALATAAAETTGRRVVALGGGCLANRPLAEGLIAGLSAGGLTPLFPRALPAGDGGLAFGQAVVGALALERRAAE